MVVSMDRWKGKVAIVTGTSAGIGAAIVEELVKQGLKVVGLARRKEKVEEIAKNLQGQPGKLYPFKADVSKEEDILAAFKWTKDTLGPIHILVNNAGIGRQASLLDGDANKWREVLDTNVLGLCVATREAVKNMRENKIDGHIIHINSVVGHTAINLPGMNIYPASKYAVTALTETLRQELNSIGSKIRITSISPGAVTTEATTSPTHELSPEMKELLKTTPFLDAQDIADSVVYVLSTPAHVQVNCQVTVTHSGMLEAVAVDHANHGIVFFIAYSEYWIHELTIKPVGEKF